MKMQSRLEEEEEAKVALMSRIQRLTKLILVSSKNTVPGYLSDVPGHQRRHSIGEDDVRFCPFEHGHEGMTYVLFYYFLFCFIVQILV